MACDIIQYVVRYRAVGIWGIHSLPILIPVNVDPLQYAKAALDEIYPRGYDIIDMKLPIVEVISDEQLESNRKHINQIINMLKRI